VTPDPEKPDIGPVAFAAEAILTVEQLASWLQVSERTVKSWPLPRLRLPGNTVRYSAGMILRYLEGKDAA
jgi:hypothetical protein